MNRSLVAAGISALLAVLSARAADPAPVAQEIGDLWEVTSQMTMDGMPPGMGIPAQVGTVCAAREWSGPPVADDERQKCQTSDFRGTPTTSTWKMHCAGPPEMTGNGEITRISPEAYKGFIKMSSVQGAITINLSGRRLSDCDPAVERKNVQAQQARLEKQIADAQAQGDEARRKACQELVDKMDLRTLKMTAPSMCPGFDVRAGICAKIETQDTFKILCPRDEADQENSLPAAATYCGADADALKKTGCDEAMKVEDLDTIGACCPVQARGIAEKECAGRSFTSGAGSKYGQFCVKYAADILAGGENAPPPPPESTKQKTKKTLKSLFPR